MFGRFSIHIECDSDWKETIRSQIIASDLLHYKSCLYLIIYEFYPCGDGLLLKILSSHDNYPTWREIFRNSLEDFQFKNTTTAIAIFFQGLN